MIDFFGQYFSLTKLRRQHVKPQVFPLPAGANDQGQDDKMGNDEIASIEVFPNFLPQSFTRRPLSFFAAGFIFNGLR